MLEEPPQSVRGAGYVDGHCGLITFVSLSLTYRAVNFSVCPFVF